MNELKIEIEISKSSNPTMVVVDGEKKQYLHSKIDPKREAESFYKIIEDDNSELLIVLGFGLGYHLSKLNVNNNRHVIIIERIENVLKYPTISEVLSLVNNESVEIISGKSVEEVETYVNTSLEIITYSTLSIVKHFASFRIFNTYYSEIEKVINTVLEKKSSNRATLNKFAYRFFKNALFHLSYIERYFPFSMLEQSLHNKNVLIVSSAPTSRIYLDEIKKNQNKLIVIAVDSAVTILNDYHIDVDLIISIDPQPWICEHLLGIIKPRIGLITTLTSYPVNIGANIFLAPSSHPVYQLLSSINPHFKEHDLPYTGSVAGDAIVMVMKYKPKCLYITGIDFSFTYNVMYSSGSSYQNRYDFILRNRFQSKETFNYKYIKNGILDGVFYTRKNFISYKYQIEKFLENQTSQIFLLRPANLECGPTNIDVCQTIKVSDLHYQKDQFSLKTNKIDFANFIKFLKRKEVCMELFKESFIPNFCIKKLLTIINNL
jgi:hypothetical protein